MTRLVICNVHYALDSWYGREQFAFHPLLECQFGGRATLTAARHSDERCLIRIIHEVYLTAVLRHHGVDRLIDHFLDLISQRILRTRVLTS